MTTIVVVRKGDSVVIAGDTLTTFGDLRLAAPYDHAHDKIIRWGDSLVGISGSAAHQVVLQSAFSRLGHPNLGSQMEIYETFRRLHPLLKDECFLNPKEEDDQPYESSQIYALIANPSGIYGVYSMREVFPYSKFWAIGSGRDFAIGAMYQAYDKLDSAEEIARAGVLAGCEFDTSSGLPMTSYTVKLAV